MGTWLSGCPGICCVTKDELALQILTPPESQSPLSGTCSGPALWPCFPKPPKFCVEQTSMSHRHSSYLLNGSFFLCPLFQAMSLRLTWMVKPSPGKEACPLAAELQMTSPMASVRDSCFNLLGIRKDLFPFV